MRPLSSKGMYAPLSDSEDTKGLISEEDCTRHASQPRDRYRRHGISIIAASAIVLAACLLSSVIGLCLGRRYPSNNGAIRHVSKYSKDQLRDNQIAGPR